MAVIYQGMLYLVNRGKKSFVSPDTIDYPFYSYVLFRHSIESTVRETMGGLGEKEETSGELVCDVCAIRKGHGSDQTTERKALDFQTD